MGSFNPQLICAFKKCDEENIIKQGCDRVDVRGFHVEEQERQGMLVDWADDGSASFHYSCWTILCIAANDGLSDLDLSYKEINMIKEAMKTSELHDSDETFQKEAIRIAEMLKSAHYCIGFTGAGISTAAGIGDYRGLHGKWTNIEKSREYGDKWANVEPEKQIQTGYPLPTYTHEALYKLMDMGVLKYLISQNTDGLHRLSGIPADKLSELHGNDLEEKCEKCKTRRKRKANDDSPGVRVPPLKCRRCCLNHRNGNICDQPDCGGYMRNIIINFGDLLEKPVLKSAGENARKSDLVLCLGTTLGVTPASDLVNMGTDQRLIICNRQATPFDYYCTRTDFQGKQLGSRVYGDCDRLMRLVMRIILGSDAAKEWEDERITRIATYNIENIYT